MGSVRTALGIRARRERGEEVQGSFFRKGKAGDWKNHFTPEQAAAYKRVAGDWFERHGYE